MTRKQQATLIATLTAELVAANATKDAANEAGHEVVFYSACDNIRRLELMIDAASHPSRPDHSGLSELVSANRD